MSAKYREIELLCSIDIEQTPESFHAHAIPEDIEICPGDQIIVMSDIIEGNEQFDSIQLRKI